MLKADCVGVADIPARSWKTVVQMSHNVVSIVSISYAISSIINDQVFHVASISSGFISEMSTAVQYVMFASHKYCAAIFMIFERQDRVTYDDMWSQSCSWQRWFINVKWWLPVAVDAGCRINVTAATPASITCINWQHYGHGCTQYNIMSDDLMLSMLRCKCPIWS